MTVITLLDVRIVTLDFMVQTVQIHVSRDANQLPVKKNLEIVWAGVKMDTWA